MVACSLSQFGGKCSSFPTSCAARMTCPWPLATKESTCCVALRKSKPSTIAAPPNTSTSPVTRRSRRISPNRMNAWCICSFSIYLVLQGITYVTKTHAKNRSINFLPSPMALRPRGFQRHSVTAQAFYHVAALDAIGKSPLGLDNWLRSGCVFINISIVFEYVLSASMLRSHQNTKILVSISRSGSADGGTVSALSKVNKRAAVAGVGMSADAAR